MRMRAEDSPAAVVILDHLLDWLQHRGLQIPELHTVILDYPNGWQERWSFPDGAKPTALRAAAQQLLDLAGAPATESPSPGPEASPSDEPDSSASPADRTPDPAAGTPESATVARVATPSGPPSAPQAPPGSPKPHRHRYRKDGTCRCGRERRKRQPRAK